MSVPIRIILPNDFRGEFRIVKDQNGTPYTREGPYYVFTIPESGELRTPNIEPFFKWHVEYIEYADGRVLLDSSQEFYKSADEVRVENRSMTAGQVRTGPTSWEHNAHYDGTTVRWAVVDAREAENPALDAEEE